MKTKQGVRRLVALTLATAVTIPQAGPVFAASPEIEKTAMPRLAQIRLATGINNGGKTGGEDRFPQLSLPLNFKQKISAVTDVTKTEGQPPELEMEKMEEWRQDPSASPPLVVTNSNNKLQTSLVETKTGEVTTIMTTEVDETVMPPSPLPDDLPETGDLTSLFEEESVVGELNVDSCKTTGREEITDVADEGSDGGNDPLFEDVVMPPEAEIFALLNMDEIPAEAPGEDQDVVGPVQPEEIPATQPAEEPSEGAEGPGAEELPSDIPPELPPAEEPSAGESSGEEIPGEEPSAEEQPADLDSSAAPLSVERAGASSVYNYAMGFGVPVKSIQGNDGVWHANLTDYGQKFQVELPPVLWDDGSDATMTTGMYPNGLTASDYGYRHYSLGKIPLERDYELIQRESGTTTTYCVFPVAAMLGRVPDKTFEGWYLYPFGSKPGKNGQHDKNELRGWVYGDVEGMIPVDLEAYEDGDWGYLESDGWGNWKLGDTWDAGRGYAEYGYKNSLESKEDYMTYPVSFVGRWVASDESRAADIDKVKDEDGLSTLESPVSLSVNGERLKLYSTDIVGVFGDALTGKETSFDRGSASGDGSEYWIRVPADVDSLDLEVNAAEIFYGYNSLEDKTGVDSPVRITWSYGGKQTLDYTAGEGGGESLFSVRMLPEEDYKDNNPNVPLANNTYDNPAYSRWTVTNIALLPSAPGEEGYQFNDITISIAPPSVYEKQQRGEELTEEDKAKITTYTFHVQRLTEPTLTQAPGNTPMGMIARDTAEETDFDRVKAAEIFRENYQFSTLYGQYPRSQVNNSGAIFRDRYSPYAWNEAGGQKMANVDLDPEAIVVYQDSAFLDPGISLTDSEGRPVSISRDNPWIVQRILKLKTAEELSIPNLTKGTDCWYQGGRLLDHTESEILSGSNDQIDLRGLKVLPGIYTLEYELVDPVADSKTYSSSQKDWVTPEGQAKADSFRRTLVVLPVPGDVDMDGAVTSADAEVLRRYLTDAQSSPVTQPAALNGMYLGTDPAVDLFAYRVANIDHDDVLDKHIENNTTGKVTDVELLETLPRPLISNISEHDSKSDYYYLPLPSTVEAVQRQTLKTDAGAAGARLELVYLGKEASRTLEEGYEGGYVNNPLGPWREGGAWTTGVNSTEAVELFDTMWVGVKLTNSAASELLKNKEVDTFTFSLVYDIRYLNPTEVLTKNQWDALGLSKDSAEERWKATARLYNMGEGSRTVWGSDSAYSFTRALQSGRSFATYDTKAITPLETAAMAEGRTSHLRELVFSVTLNDMRQGISLDSQGDVWLLAVPFILVQHPVGQDRYQGVEMQAGMSDFTLLFQEGGEMVTAAYNPLTEDIFGGKTANLATSVAYVNAGPEVPLGKDNSEVYYIRSESKAGISTGAKDVVYSEYFEAQLGWKKNGEEYEYVHTIPARAIMRYAPDWLSYDNTSGKVSGIPEAAGTYYFTIANHRYQLDVAQAPLHYWAESQSSYYGENEFRGTNSGDFIFRYTTSDIRSIDQARADNSGGTIVNDGRGESLSGLLDDKKYQAPGFTAVDKMGQPVLTGTGISEGAYAIRATREALSGNYDMIYAPELGDGEKGLTVLPRPLRVEELLVENVGRIFSDEAGILSNLTATLDSTAAASAGFRVGLIPSLDTDEPGHYNGLPLSGHNYVDGVLLPGDSLVLEYRAELLQTETDRVLSVQGGGRYALTDPEETRVAQISGIRIKGGRNSENYTIFEQREPVVNGEAAGVVGTVRRRNVISFTFVRVPPLEYHTGDQLNNATALWFNIVKEGDRDNIEGDYPYNEETTLLRHGVTVSWATEEEKQAGVKGSLPYKSQQTFTMDFDGRYLCMSSEIGKDENGQPKTVVVYYDTPLRIIPRSLTLTAVETSRFYGEKNGELKFTYDPRQLSIEHQERLLQLFGGSVDDGPRDGAELEQILVDGNGSGEGYYKPPVLTAVDAVETRVPLDERSKYTGSTTNVVLIQGAWCKDYKIDYTYTSKGTSVVQEDWGASPFSISRRMIVVEALRETERTRNLTTMYADTKRIYTEGLTLGMEDVVLRLPNRTADGGIEYYPRYGAAQATVLEKGYESENALVGEDKVSFVYTATMASQDGADYVKWTSFSKGHFNMEGADADGNRRYPVQVGRITLAGADANNYELVFRDNTAATLEAPTQLETVSGCIDPNVNARKNYYIPKLVREETDGSLTRTGRGEGTVTLRPIEKMEIISTGKLDYTYGDVYVPDQAGGDKNLGLQIHIEYAKDYENYAQNITSGTLEFKVSRYDENRTPVTTFDERGLAIYYQRGTETTAVVDSQRLDYRTALSLDPHDGTYLVVAGKRAGSHQLIQSAPSKEQLTVRARTLTLRADDQYRVYGEENPRNLTFTFDANQLAPQDQQKLGMTSGWQSGALLSGLGLAYTAPVFTTDAQRKSDVKSGGKDGYAIRVDSRQKGSLENYALEYPQDEEGTLYIYPRRVQIGEFLKKPIYTIYSDIPENIVYANAFINKTETDFTLRLSGGDYRPDGAPGALPITGQALVDGDEMSLKIKIEYPIDWRASSEKSFNVKVTDASLLPGTRAAGNYVLDTQYGGAVIAVPESKGNVELRSITDIKIAGVPEKREYLYGETLELDGLRVEISYQQGNDESNIITETIFYRHTEDFAGYGLYVNYYPYPEITAEDRKPENWSKLRDKYYTAATGDHVTIAPTHASMDPSLPVGSPKREFAANGQYLIISGQRDADHEAAAPKLVTDDSGRPVQIKVNPLTLEFTLSADDKVYDSTTQATGTLTFTNAFYQQGYVDAYNQNVTDMVYPVTGADYEAKWGGKLTPQGNSSFSEYIAAQDPRSPYRFSTGEEGYAYGADGTMTFSFQDPNVAYEGGEPTIWDVYGRITSKEVQVKGLRLAGADAANYVLKTDEVTPENVSRAEGYLGGNLPRATIRKADREPMSLDVLPTVAVDPNTNVVRVIYDQPISAIKGVKGAESGEAAEYYDELHFEYALQYDATEWPEQEEPTEPEDPDQPVGQTEKTTLVVEQWAGPRGGQLWGDETFYGGETVSLEYPEGYLPREEDIPKGSEENMDRKGQVYAWAGEDGGFILDEDAYPGGEIWPGYDLYKTERTALDRDRIYWPVVRVAETHNYNASPAISSAAGYTPEMIQAVLTAREALSSAASDSQYAAAQEAMDRAAGAALSAMAEALDGAVTDAEAEQELMTGSSEGGRLPEDWAGRAPAAAVKTYAQSLELVSVEELEGAASPEPPQPDAPESQIRTTGEETGKYLVPTLEAVWFTDVQEYPDKKLMDAVVRNASPVRYQDYAWDSAQTAPLFADEQEVLSLKEPFEVTVTQEGDEETTQKILVNEENKARIYVELRSNSGGGSLVPVSEIRIDSDDLVVQEGADPVYLKVVILPENATNRGVRWSSSDESVATVDRNGKVTFVGIGIAVITATSVEGASDSITVTVRGTQDWREMFPNSIFNMGLEDPFFQMQEDVMLFHPQWEMTRGETAQLLARFYLENPNWTRTGPDDFPDLTGEESYAPAARLLGSVGVFVGLPDGRFGGEQTITRAEFIVLLTRMIGVEIPDTTGEVHAFLDTGEEDTWAYQEIDAMGKVPGVLLGVGEGYFAPTRSITRAEAAVFLTRLLQFPLAGEDPVVPRDVGEGHWARGSILRAVNRGTAPKK